MTGLASIGRRESTAPSPAFAALGLFLVRVACSVSFAGVGLDWLVEIKRALEMSCFSSALF